jgi:hypothetical protein
LLRDEYNPIVNPEQYRAQTLRDVNFYMSIMPWIDAGIVEFIRTPSDFDRRLNINAMQHAKSLGDVPEIKDAMSEAVIDLESKHYKNEALHTMLLSMPDDYLRRTFRKLSLGNNTFTEDDFIAYVRSMRDRNPDFLEPLGSGENRARLYTIFSGGTYQMACLSAQMSGSYLFTDLRVKWQ